MSEWNDMFSQVERTYLQVGRLLRDADGLLDLGGLQVADGKGNAVGMESSGSLDKPAWWFAGWMGRFYRSPKGSGARPIAHVSVLLYSRRGDNMRRLAEPVVTAGVWQFHEPNGAWRYWMAKAWGWGEAHPADGSLVERPINGHGVHALGRVFAVPLVSLDGPDALENRVVAPLLALHETSGHPGE